MAQIYAYDSPVSSDNDLSYVPQLSTTSSICFSPLSTQSGDDPCVLAEHDTAASGYVQQYVGNYYCSKKSARFQHAMACKRESYLRLCYLKRLEDLLGIITATDPTISTLEAQAICLQYFDAVAVHKRMQKAAFFQMKCLTDCEDQHLENLQEAFLQPEPNDSDKSYHPKTDDNYSSPIKSKGICFI